MMELQINHRVRNAIQKFYDDADPEVPAYGLMDEALGRIVQAMHPGQNFPSRRLSKQFAETLREVAEAIYPE